MSPIDQGLIDLSVMLDYLPIIPAKARGYDLLDAVEVKRERGPINGSTLKPLGVNLCTDSPDPSSARAEAKSLLQKKRMYTDDTEFSNTQLCQTYQFLAAKIRLPPGGMQAGIASEHGRSTFIGLRNRSGEDIIQGNGLGNLLAAHLLPFLCRNDNAMDLFRSKYSNSGSIRRLIGIVSCAHRADLVSGLSGSSSVSANAGASLAAGPAMNMDALHGETEEIHTTNKGVVGVGLRVCSVEVRNRGREIALVHQFSLDRWDEDGSSMQSLRAEQQWSIVAEARRLFAGVCSSHTKVIRYAIPENAEMAGRSFEEVYNEDQGFELLEGSNIGDGADALVTVVHSGPDAQEEAVETVAGNIGILLSDEQYRSDYQAQVDASYKGCFKLLISGHLKQLSELYEKCKVEPFELEGSGYKIVSVVPAFRVQDDCFLPIVHEEADNNKVPRWVHRMQDDVTYLIPVVNGGSPTVVGIHDDKWFVQEDIVLVPSKDVAKIDTLTKHGYLQLADDFGGEFADDVDGELADVKLVFGLHVLREKEIEPREVFRREASGQDKSSAPVQPTGSAGFEGPTKTVTQSLIV
jgi:hypothetical protein